VVGNAHRLNDNRLDEIAGQLAGSRRRHERCGLGPPRADLLAGEELLDEVRRLRAELARGGARAGRHPGRLTARGALLPRESGCARARWAGAENALDRAARCGTLAA
jgi:hypothetical protein